MLGSVLGVLALAPAAQAQDMGWYGAFDLGYHWPTDSDVELQDDGTELGEVSHEGDWAGFARLGNRFAHNWRGELEFGARPGDIEGFTAEDGSEVGVSGSFKTLSLMGNLLFDFMPESSFTPFVGVGVGGIRASLNAVEADEDGEPAFQPAFFVDDEDTTFAWQGILGAAFRATDRLTADLTYRYLDATELNFENQSENVMAIGDLSDLEGCFRESRPTFRRGYGFIDAERLARRHNE